jgi:hypothetical protein
MAKDSFKIVDSDEELDSECMVFSADYPHGDSKYPHATESFLKLPMIALTRETADGRS